METRNINYLLAERRGCEFFKGDAEAFAASDVGNYRLFIRFTAKDGTKVYGDVGGFDRRDYSKPAKPITHRNELYNSMCHYTAARDCFGWKPRKSSEKYTYTTADILKWVNANSRDRYDAIKYVFTADFYQPIGENFTPAAKLAEWAKKNRIEFTEMLDGAIYHLYSGDYKYMFYEIEPMPNGDKEPAREKVTIYIERAEKTDKQIFREMRRAKHNDC